MQLRQLATFVAIAECGTLTAASQRLYKTQGAVSHDLRSLEREIDVILIDRSGQRIRLTPAGAALLPHAIELLQRADDIRTESARMSTGSVGGVRLGTPPSLSSAVLEQVLAYHGRLPDVRFTFFTELQGMLVDGLVEGRLDLVIAEPELRNELNCTPLDSEDILIAVRRDDPLAASPKLAAAELLGHPFVGFIREMSSTRLAERFFTPTGQYPSPVVEVDDFRLMRRLILGGIGFGIMPRSALDDDDGEIVGVPADPPLTRDIAVLTPANRLVSPGVTGFRDAIVRTWSSSTMARTGRPTRAA
jgi:DNA-binding transcriptional LysR family regulator